MSNSNKFRNKVVIITGASSGIGKETAILFAQQGANLVLAARNTDALDKLQKQLPPNSQSLVLRTDVTQKEDLKNLIDKTIERFKQIDILINNAGLGLYGELSNNKDSDIEQVIDVNIRGLILCSAYVTPVMKKQGFGQIINISSVLGKFAIPKMAAYCASKYAVQGFSDSLRAELKRYGIKVITVCPTTTQTEFFNKMPSGTMKPNNPFIMTPEKVAKIILKASIKNKSEVVISFSGKILSFSNRCFPGIIRFLLSKYKGTI
jgi:uncharacterized protein